MARGSLLQGRSLQPLQKASEIVCSVHDVDFRSFTHCKSLCSCIADMRTLELLTGGEQLISRASNKNIAQASGQPPKKLVYMFACNCISMLVMHEQKRQWQLADQEHSAADVAMHQSTSQQQIR